MFILEILGVLLSHDRTLVQRAYRAAIIAARLGKSSNYNRSFINLFSGHDKCLETLLDYGLDPNIMDRTRTTPLHVAYVKQKRKKRKSININSFSIEFVR